jgi:hypothetical protein
LDTVTQVEIMRSGRWGWRVAAAGAVLVTGACAQGPGVAGVSSTTPAALPSPTGSPSVTATIPPKVPQKGPQKGAVRPTGDEPVKVPPPKVSKYSYVFPVKGCSATYQRRLMVLPKITIWAAQGCSFVAPVNGVVDEVNVKNRWRPSTDRGVDREGRFVTIIGDDGVRYLGGHLDSVAPGIAPGVRVGAGQLLGRVGKSGNARDTGANLYFAISWKTGPAYWWVRRGMIEPWSYLDAWATGNKTLSPRDATLALRGRLGETPRCQVLCKSKKVPQPAKTTEKEPEPQDAITVGPTAVSSTRP